MTAGWRLPAILPDPHHFRMGDMIASAALSSVAPRFVNARVRALIDDRGKPVKSAGPSTPVEVLGLAGLPHPGDVFQV